MIESTKEKRNISIDYLRAFLMILVIIHHTILAYTPTGYGALINDPNNFTFFQNIAAYFDTFIMSLFFFLSGIFSLKSIENKGTKKFLGDRFLRLMLPFTLGILIINVFGYYLSWIAYFQVPLSFSSFFEYSRESIGRMPGGPLWFLWVLYIFDIIIALLYNLKKNWCNNIRNSHKKFYTHPGRFLAIFTLLALLAFYPFASLNGGGFVAVFLPFAMQTSRFLLYFVFFLIGAMIGVFPIERSVLSREGMLSKYWWAQIAISIVATIALIIAFSNIDKALNTNVSLAISLIIVSKLVFIISCVFASFGFIGLFNKLTKPSKFWDLIVKHAMGIYVVHYTIVTLFQYLLLKIDMLGLQKAIIVVVCSLFTSLCLVILLKYIPILRLSVGAKYTGKKRVILIIVNLILLIFIIYVNAVNIAK